MSELLFVEILFILTVSLLAVAAFRRLNLPPTLAYLAVGILCGPGGFQLVSSQAAIDQLAQFGMAFLLFSLGLEFSLPRLFAMRRTVLGLGGGQVVLTTAVLMVIALLMGLPPMHAIIVAAALSLSSTAMVTKELTGRNELHTRFGQLSFAVLLFQDMVSVLMLVTIPALAADGHLILDLGVVLLESIGLFAVMFLVSKFLLPLVFFEAARSRSDELFVLATLVVVLLTSSLTHYIGVSMALGAFTAGMMLGESHYRHQIEAELRPFRDVLLGFFFVSVGMLIDIQALAPVWHWALLLAGGLMVLKTALVVVLARRQGENAENSLRAALTLAQGGEFGFALIAQSRAYGLTTAANATIVLAAIFVTMLATPFIIRSGKHISRLLLRPSHSDHGSQAQAANVILAGMTDHVILCGFGRVGQSVARFLSAENIAYAAIDSDPVRVQEATLAGEPVLFGDVRKMALLRAMGLNQARLVVIAFDGFRDSMTILRQIRAISLDIPVLVRTADDEHWEALRQAGATEVVPEILEGSLMLVSHVLTLLGLAPERIQDRVQEARTQRYQLLHGYLHGQRSKVMDDGGKPLPMLHALPINEGAYALGRTLEDLRLVKIGVHVQALRRGGESIQNPELQMVLLAGDILVLQGTATQIERAEALLLRPPPRSRRS